ncbi:MAG: hypothetical protein COU46_03100 [Candidatus Niyogibacteria bacterium CG10_big_fil_rev_8_21_14_0_10_42_19]|uniref:Transglycosylase SLT domain-containing protein n=1 Tax=Candidatus Niyogibacteria bacterium CG10_big_fil_rev_8_21_14_0_10_42_19 TaxID=1974725 RepID=A0A2H0TH19_9BACT|nr:MAG: hypothetical protein COU46_03100 [Candidatus Niyogibacteria bacterium CG10_big_fil_rev_8_21_14_0_10_42_19]
MLKRAVFAFAFVFLAFFTMIPFIIKGQVVDPSLIIQKRAELESELQALENQINGYRSLIQEKQTESTTLERDIAILDAKISKAFLEIKARDIVIRRLAESIEVKSGFLEELTLKLDREKYSLAELIRKVYEIDETNLVELLLSYDNFSDFFVDLDNFDTLQASLQISFGQIRNTHQTTEVERSELEDKKSEQLELRAIQLLEKKQIEEFEQAKRTILKQTKGKEAEYQKILTARQKDAAQIRSQLFLLTGSPDIPFEKAVEFANAAFSATGVRPAFLLAIITQETNLGQNIGQCLLTNIPNKGDGKGKNTGRFFSGVMKSTRDVDPFMQITSTLGLDPFQMPVSCPPGYGYGGAMGPAQFIASTWKGMENKIASLTGHNPPNPWDPYDAFMASAIYLRDLGVSEGGYEAERKAALRYFAGSNWSKPTHAFYGDDVMAIAFKYQSEIDIISR